MAEYYAVLSKAVAGLDTNSADARRAVYDKARNALIGQLKAIDPPLPTAEISRQRLELEEAIRRVERETSTVPSGSPVKVAPAKRTPLSDRPPPPSPQDVFRRAIQEAEQGSSASEARESSRAPVPARADDWSSDRFDRPPPAKPVPQYLPSQGYVEEKPRADEPRLAPDYNYDWDAKAAPPNGRAVEPSIDARDRAGKPTADKRGSARGATRYSRAETQDVEHPVRPSRLPAIILLVLIIAMVGGLAALGYSQRAKISNIIGGFDADTAAPAASTTKTAAPADTSGKDTDRLLPGQESGAASATRVVTPDNNSSAAGAATDTAPAPSKPQASAAQPDPDSLVAQHATLYEEPIDSAAAANGVVAINAAVTWSFVSTGADGPEIVGNIDVPERGLKVKLTIRKNSDQSLPASHVVEVALAVPANFPGKSIRDVPRVVLKPAEDARGQPLIGASAKVGDSTFWIGLSSEGADVDSNLKLLREREWFDLPLLYESGQRAILTFEKGTPGDRVFDKAIGAWSG